MQSGQPLTAQAFVVLNARVGLGYDTCGLGWLLVVKQAHWQKNKQRPDEEMRGRQGGTGLEHNFSCANWWGYLLFGLQFCFGAISLS